MGLLFLLPLIQKLTIISTLPATQNKVPSGPKVSSTRVDCNVGEYFPSLWSRVYNFDNHLIKRCNVLKGLLNSGMIAIIYPIYWSVRST